MDREALLRDLIGRAGVDVERDRVDAAGVDTHYLRAGSGPPVVLLHGAGAGAVTWHTAIGPLAERKTVIAPDIVGYGESDKPKAAYDGPYLVSWLGAFLDALGLDRVPLVGNSQGGAVALRFTLAHPERVSRLALVGAGAIAPMPTSVLRRLMRFYALPTRRVSAGMSDLFYVDASDIPDSYGEYSRAVVKSPGGRRFFFMGGGAVVEPVDSERLAGIEVPVLMVWGDGDAFFDIDIARIASRIIPDATFEVMRGTGHLGFLERPDEFASLIVPFVQADA